MNTLLIVYLEVTGEKSWKRLFCNKMTDSLSRISLAAAITETEDVTRSDLSGIGMAVDDEECDIVW